MPTKTIIRDQVREYLLHQMLKGKLQLGKTVNLAAVARELGVSVTPIREALSQLEQSHIIEAVPNRGFIIAELSPDEARDLYDLVANLEEMALQNSVFDSQTIDALKEQQFRFEQAGNALAKIHADLEFHRILTSLYPNKLTRQILSDLRTRIFFYERALLSADGSLDEVDNQHAAIIAAIEDDNVPTAALLLKMNWMFVLNVVQKRLLPV